MATIVTLTLNPTVDSSCEADRVVPIHKVRTHNPRYDPGGGGINVARVLARLGDTVDVAYLSGGPTGALLDELLVPTGLPCHPVRIAAATRMSLAVFDHSTGQEYRFVPDGPQVTADELARVFDLVVALDSDWLVASGSLPPGLPDDTYARLAALLAGGRTRLVLDTSGPALAAALEAGGLFLAKPSQGEFETLTGRRFASRADLGQAAAAIVAAGKVEHLAVTLGHEGAILASAAGIFDMPGIAAPVRSATGAGDSFVAGMVHGFAAGEDAASALRWGMAAGTAAVLSPGTGLCDAADVRRIRAELT